MNTGEDKKYSGTGKLALAFCAGVVLYVALEHGWVRLLLNIFYPVTAGAAIAYMVDPLARFAEYKIFQKVPSERRRRVYACVFAILTVILAIVLLLLFLIPQIIDSINLFVGNLASYFASLRAWLSDVAAQFTAGDGILPLDANRVNDLFGSVDTTLEGFLGWLMDNIGSIGGSTFEVGRGIVNFSVDLMIRLMNGGLAVILAIYFLFGKKGILENGKRIAQAAMNGEQYKHFNYFLAHCNAILIRYIIFDLVDALIVGVANGIFMAVMGMPYVVIVSLIVGVTNLAPTFGPIVGGVLGGLFLLLVNPWYALWFIIFTLVLQTIDGYIIKPKLFGDQLGISSVLVLVFIIVGGRLVGIYGVLLSIPCAAIVDFVYRDYLLGYLTRRKERKQYEKARRMAIASGAMSKKKREVKEDE
ncbi:MAG: AI-2E family transporter [Lachnospiraceae bacterium]|nr:AI-2E family transporter [Lachnospiraceae bacterium]